jgi:hypothetical protein
MRSSGRRDDAEHCMSPSPDPERSRARVRRVSGEDLLYPLWLFAAGRSLDHARFVVPRTLAEDALSPRYSAPARA